MGAPCFEISVSLHAAMDSLHIAVMADNFPDSCVKHDI
jgi:hypothetical protein